jgi:hypothetical protein
MKNLFTIIVIVANLSGIAHCQDYLSQVNLENVGGYNKHINCAELAITDAQYYLAIKEYDSAASHHSLFCNDRYNNAVCEALLGKNKECSDNLRYLLEKGLEDTIIHNNTAFRKFLRSKEGKNLVKSKIELTYNVKLRAEYDSLLYEDQCLRLQIPYGDSIRRVDSSNVFKMNRLIEEFGWPTDDLIGNLDFSDEVFPIIINHQRNPRTRVYDYTKDLYYAYGNGEIEVHDAAWLIELLEGSNKYLVNTSGIVTVVLDSLSSSNRQNIENFTHVIGFLKLSDESLKMYNSNRELFGLESIEDFRNKLLYFSKDKRFSIAVRGWFSTYQFSSLEDYNYASGKIDECL